MSIEVAERGVDIAFETTAWALTIEFQGGEPTANWDGAAAHRRVRAAEERRGRQKVLSFALVTNLSLMDDEKLDFLLDRHVQICTSLDGPADLHNKIRIFKGGNSHELVLGWMKKINQRYADMGLDTNHYRVEALPTITRPSLTPLEGHRRPVRRGRLPRHLPAQARSVRLRRQERQDARLLDGRVPGVLRQRRRLHHRAQPPGRPGDGAARGDHAQQDPRRRGAQLPRPAHPRRRLHRPDGLRAGRQHLLVRRGPLRRLDGRRHVQDRHRATTATTS